VFNALSQWLWGAGLEILKAGVGLADKFGSVNLDVHSGPMAAVWSVTLPIGLAVAGCIFYFSLATVPFQGRGGVLRAVRGIGQFGVALAGSIGAFASLVALSDAFTSFILSKGLSSANFDEAFTHTGFSDVTANAVKGGALALMSLFGVIPIGLGFAFENVMRAATIYLLAAVIPITAAGLLSGNTASWYWKTAHWMMAAIAMKPVMALALALGVGIAGGGQGLVALIVGLAVLFVALFAPLALFRLFAFASEKATDGFKSGWSSSGAEDAVHGATDTVTSMVSGSDSTSSMESSTDTRYSDASSSTDTDTGTGDSSTGATGRGGEQMGGTANEPASAETGSDTPGTDTDRQQQAPGGDEQGANGTGETADAHAVQQGDVAATAPADVPGEGGTDSPPAPDAAGASQQPSQQPAEQGAGSSAQQPAEQGAGSGAQQPAEQGAGSGAQQPAEQGAGSGAQQEQMPAPPTPAGGGSGEQSPAPSSSAGGAGDGAQAPSAPSSSGGSGDGAQAPSAPPGASGGAPAPQPFANDAARSGGGGNAGSSGGGAGGSGGGAAGGAGAGDAAAAAAV